MPVGPPRPGVVAVGAASHEQMVQDAAANYLPDHPSRPALVSPTLRGFMGQAGSVRGTVLAPIGGGGDPPNGPEAAALTPGGP